MSQGHRPRFSHCGSWLLHPGEQAFKGPGRLVPQEALCSICPWAGLGRLTPGGGGQVLLADVTRSSCEVVELDRRVLRLLRQMTRILI